jgi:hypothetical protein
VEPQVDLCDVITLEILLISMLFVFQMEPLPMIRAVTSFRRNIRLCVATAIVVVIAWSMNAPRQVDAQGLFKGVQQGAREGNKAAGPVGGVLGGAIGGVVGVVTGVAGAIVPPPTNNSPPVSQAPATEAADAKKPKGARGKATRLARLPPTVAATSPATAPTSAAAVAPALMTQPGAPALTAEQIVVNSDANIERIKNELNLSAEQDRHWGPFASAMHYLGHNGADRLNLRVARAKRDPPDDVIEQMRNEAQFLVDRAADQRNVADSAEPLFANLDDRQKQVFIDEMVKLSHERGLD